MNTPWLINSPAFAVEMDALDNRPEDGDGQKMDNRPRSDAPGEKQTKKTPNKQKTQRTQPPNFTFIVISSELTIKNQEKYL